jgi:hypothetical protein
MKWFKHDSDANMDAKLQEVLLDYGLEGYGLYWYCIEMIVNKLEHTNITFALEHDARIIARNTGSSAKKVEEMMKRFISLGLFESSDGVITCFKLAKRLDQSMTNSTKMRSLISKIKESGEISANLPAQRHDDVMTESGLVMKEKKRKEKKESANKFSDDDLVLAKWMYSRVLEVMPKAKEPNFNRWADDIRKMREIDNLSRDEITGTFEWANSDSFWQINIQSPAKLREKFPQLHAKGQQGTVSDIGGFDLLDQVAR